MCLFNIDEDDYGYDHAFDFDHDGELNFFERSEQLDFYTTSCATAFDEEDEDEETEDICLMNGLDLDELEDMDEDERREALEDAGLDPDDYDF